MVKIQRRARCRNKSPGQEQNKMKFFKYFETEKTIIEVSFSYKESCRNIYKHFSVTRNGKSSNITGLKKFLKSDYPSILTANTYFWTPNCNASGRRRAEERRESEVFDYFTAEGFSLDENTFYLESEKTAKGETFGIDSENGYFIEYRGHKYHFGYVKKITAEMYDQARQAIAKRRIQDIAKARQQKQYDEMKSKVFVTFDDSIEAGNCRVGTENFYNTIPLVKKGFHIRAIKATALLSLRNDTYTQRAVSKAIEKSIAI